MYLYKFVASYKHIFNTAKLRFFLYKKSFFIFQFLIIHPTFLIIGLTVIVLGRLPFPTVTILSGFRNGTLSTTLSRIAANGEAAWRSGGFHYR